MDNERLPIKFFATREIDELRIEGSRNSDPPKWLLTGQELTVQYNYGIPSTRFLVLLSQGHLLLFHSSL